MQKPPPERTKPAPNRTSDEMAEFLKSVQEQGLDKDWVEGVEEVLDGEKVKKVPPPNVTLIYK